MNEKDLLYFCKLVETGNYTLTANTFDVTQPTISMAIKRLADKFADPLILQKNRKSKIALYCRHYSTILSSWNYRFN